MAYTGLSSLEARAEPKNTKERAYQCRRKQCCGDGRDFSDCYHHAGHEIESETEAGYDRSCCDHSLARLSIDHLNRRSIPDAPSARDCSIAVARRLDCVLQRGNTDRALWQPKTERSRFETGLSFRFQRRHWSSNSVMPSQTTLLSIRDHSEPPFSPE